MKNLFAPPESYPADQMMSVPGGSSALEDLHVRYIFKKGDHIVVRALFDLVHACNVERCFPSNDDGIFLRDSAKKSHRFAGENFDLEPNLQLALLAPKRAHLRQGIASDHRASVDLGTRQRPMKFCAPKNSRRRSPPARSPDEDEAQLGNLGRPPRGWHGKGESPAKEFSR